jgi:hypothetical protein
MLDVEAETDPDGGAIDVRWNSRVSSSNKELTNEPVRIFRESETLLGNPSGVALKLVPGTTTGVTPRPGTTTLVTLLTGTVKLVELKWS